jgi:hypothetical protein
MVEVKHKLQTLKKLAIESSKTIVATESFLESIV